MPRTKIQVGVAVIGRPVSRYLDDGLTVEVNRLCTTGEKVSVPLAGYAPVPLGENAGPANAVLLLTSARRKRNCDMKKHCEVSICVKLH